MTLVNVPISDSMRKIDLCKVVAVDVDVVVVVESDRRLDNDDTHCDDNCEFYRSCRHDVVNDSFCVVMLRY